MGGQSILIPGCSTPTDSTFGACSTHTHWESSNEPTCSCGASHVPGCHQYLEKTNYLSEFSTELEKTNARANINVKSVEESDADIQEAINSHMVDNGGDPHNTKDYIDTELESYVKKDGTTPFTSPQQGVAAIADNDLLIKSQLDNYLLNYTTPFPNPTVFTAGGLFKDTILAQSLPFKDVLDMILYGTNVSVSTLEYVPMGTSFTNVAVTITGPKSNIATVTLTQAYSIGGVKLHIATWDNTQFLYSNTTNINSLILQANNIFEVVVRYTDGTVKVASSTTKISTDTYVGIIPATDYPANIANIDINYINNLIATDPTNNAIVPIQTTLESGITYLSHTKAYNFNSNNLPGAQLQHIFIAWDTATHGDLLTMDYSLQRYTEDDFDIFNKTYVLSGVPKNYRLAIYKGSALRLVGTSTFRFNSI